MAITKRIEWKDVGALGQRIQNMELWNADDENGVIFAQTFAPEFIDERFSLTKIRIKAWRTGEINEIVAVILPIAIYTIDGFNFYYRPNFSAVIYGYGSYAGVIPESDPGDDSEDWIEIELSGPLSVEGRWYELEEGHNISVNHFYGYAICLFVSDGAGVLHIAYMTPKSWSAGVSYADGQKVRGVYPYEWQNWQECKMTVFHYSSFLFELWVDDALPQVPLVQTLGY